MFIGLAGFDMTELPDGTFGALILSRGKTAEDIPDDHMPVEVNDDFKSVKLNDLEYLPTLDRWGKALHA